MRRLFNWIKAHSPFAVAKPLFAAAKNLLWTLGQILKRNLERLFPIIGPPLGYVLRPVGIALLWFARVTRLNRIFPWRYLYLIAKPYLTQDRWFEAWLLFGFTVLMMVLTAKSAYYMGVRLKDLTDVIDGHGTDAAYYSAMTWLAGTSVCWAMSSVTYGFVRSWFGLDWRMWETQMLLRLWTMFEAYLRITLGMPELDNMDQRLAQDPDTAANTIVWLSIIILDAIVNGYTFLPVLFASDWKLVAGCLFCAVVSYGAVFYLGRKLPKLTFQQWKVEADLRTGLQAWIRNAVAIGTMRQEHLAQMQALGSVANVQDTLWEVMKVNRNVSFFTTTWGKVVEYGPYSYIGWLLLHGSVKNIGAIGQGVQAFGNVHTALTVFVGQFGALSNLRAQCERLGPLCEVLEQLHSQRKPDGDWITYGQSEKIVCRKLSVYSGYLDPKLVVKELDIEITDDVMFAAPEGQGKAKLARAFILGAAPGKGEIDRPSPAFTHALVQNPYMPTCSLKQFLCDRMPEMPADAQIQEKLSLVELKGLAEKSGGLDTPQDWKAKLSAPEQLQLCFARAILSGAKILIIDQALQGLQPEYSVLVYRIAKALGMQVITFANDVATAKYHTRVVELSEDGSYKIMPADQFKEPGWRSLFRNLLGGGDDK